MKYQTAGKGFTIIELMVVVGIVALLASILLPILTSARKMVALSSCQNNLRQLIQSVMLYTADNDGQLPYCNWTSAGPTDPTAYPHGWLFSYSPSWPTTLPPLNGMKTGVLWPYNESAIIYHCPQDNQDTEIWSRCHRLSSYTMNGAECKYEQVISSPGLPLRAFQNDAYDVLMWEAIDALWNDGASYPSEASITDRHYNGGNVACLDGHVEWWVLGDFTTQSTLEPGRLWCNPKTTNGAAGG